MPLLAEIGDFFIIKIKHMNLFEKLMEKIEQLDFKGQNNEFREKIRSVVLEAVSNNLPLNLISFTCSTINPAYLFSDTPWLYVRTNPENNNLSPDIVRLEGIVSELKLIYPKTQLKILIGNTDPYYIYLEQFNNFPQRKELLWQEFSARWKEYQKEFCSWLKKIAPNLDAEVISWYEFEKRIEKREGRYFEREYDDFRARVNDYFNQSQLDWEFRKLVTQFGENGYFSGLLKPDDKLLKDWIIRKFSEYAIQATWIYENIDNAILIQNEKPSELRSQMYQPQIKSKYNDSLPIVYFFGVDNQGYQ